MKTRHSAVVLAILYGTLALVVAACGGGGSSKTTSTPVAKTATVPTQAPATSAPVGPVVRYNTKFDVANPPAAFGVAYLVQEFVPGAASPLHSHGGQGYATVLDGELTIRSKDGEKKYKAGETFVENADEPLQAVNTSTANTTFAITFLLPKTAMLTTSRQVGTPVPSPAPVVRYNTVFEVVNPPAQFDLVHLVQDFAPGSLTPRHMHGGQGFATVLDGEITIRLKDGEKKYKAGETFVETAGDTVQAANTSTPKTSFSIVFLLPKGAPLTTNSP